MRLLPYFAIVLTFAAAEATRTARGAVLFSGERRQNNLVSELLIASSVGPGETLTVNRPADGWLFVSATFGGAGKAQIFLDDAPANRPLVQHQATDTDSAEAMHWVTGGKHRLRVQGDGGVRVEQLVVKAIPELIHCGLGLNPAIKAYGLYDMAFLKKDILPNVTTLVVPSNISLPQAVIDDWHRQGKKFIAEVGIVEKSKTADEHVKHWLGYFDRSPLLDGILINEFIINEPYGRRSRAISPERRRRRELEQQRYRLYEEAIKKIHADPRYRDKMIYGYVGGSGKTLNQEIVGPTFIHAFLECNYRIALERYIFEVSSEQKSRDALAKFVAGIADWNAKEPGINKNLVLAFGLFSMPPGGINKQPNVDYHVWMDQQMNVVANDPTFKEIAGFEWWTSLLADEETVRFVGKLYRHYAILGRKDLLTRDPLFLPHLQNADFEKGLEGWSLRAAEPGSIAAKSFPRYGRIEGRYMGLGRPADPEHIGDTFLWMKRSKAGPNAFSQTVKNLEPGRLYSLKMFSCDYNDLVHPKKKTEAEANKFVGRVDIEGVEIDGRRSFSERYASNPEPPIPVWITYHWIVFRAKGTTAKLMVSDDDPTAGTSFGQEQAFNFLELEPYHE